MMKTPIKMFKKQKGAVFRPLNKSTKAMARLTSTVVQTALLNDTDRRYFEFSL